MKLIYTGLAAGLLISCAHMAPKELVGAREAYNRASNGPAAKLTPSDVHKAKVALDSAETQFQNDPDSQEAKDLAYVAERSAQLAEVLAMQSQDELDKKASEAAFVAKQGQQNVAVKKDLANTKAELAAGNMRSKEDGEKLAAARIGRQDAEDKTAEANRNAADANKNAADANIKTAKAEAKNAALEAAIASLAAVKQEPRGLVMTLSGGVMFVSNQATLLPSAQSKLDQISAALISSSDTTESILIEGYTDSVGGDAHNITLSQRRAQAVRDYIVSRGYPTEKIRSNGMGKANPVASNANAEGRANNRRVEIIIAPVK